MKISVFCGLALLCMSCSQKDEEPYNSSISRTEYRYGISSSNTLDVVSKSRYDETMPVLIYVHGGGWNGGDKNEWNEENSRFFLENGIISVALNYSLSPKPVELDNPDRVKYPTMLGDIARGVEWVGDSIAKLGGDAHNMFLMGHSSGAQLVILMTLQQRIKLKDNVAIRGVVSLDAGAYLVMDKKLMDQTEFEYLWKNAFDSSNYDNPDMNPKALISKNSSLPDFLMIFSSDKMRQFPNEEFIRELENNNFTCQYHLVPGMSHDAFKRLGNANLELSDLIVNFVKRNVVDQ